MVGGLELLMGGVSYSAGAMAGGGLPGLWWAGAMGPDPHLLFSPLLPVFSSRGRGVRLSYTPYGSIGLTLGLLV